MRNTVAKKQAVHEDLDSGYLFASGKGEIRALCDALTAAEGRLKP